MSAINTLAAAATSAAAASSSTGLSLATGVISTHGEIPAAQPFSSLLTDAVGQVNTLEQQARSTVDGLMTGTGVDVHQAMIATQKASMAFELALSVRNKAVQAYQSVMGMQF
jgi:flagellar hook-basal body complex protein FliE